MKDYNHGNFNGVPYKIHFFIEMQFAAHFFTVIPYQALFRLPVYKKSAVGRSGAIFLSFCKIRDFGSPTILINMFSALKGSQYYFFYPRCYILSFMKIGPPVLEKKIFEWFYHIWAWRPSWSCDLDLAIKLQFPLPMDAPHKILL